MIEGSRPRGRAALGWLAALPLGVLAAVVIVAGQYGWGLIALVGMVFAALSFWRPQLALVVFLIYEPLERALARAGLELYSVQALNAETVIIVIYAVLVIPVVVRHFQSVRAQSRVLVPTALLAGLILLSTTWNPHWGTETFVGDLKSLKSGILLLAAFVLFLVTPDKRRYAPLYVATFVLVCAFLSADLIVLRSERVRVLDVGDRVIAYGEGVVHSSALVVGLGATVLTGLVLSRYFGVVGRAFMLLAASAFALSAFLLVERALAGGTLLAVCATLVVGRARVSSAWILPAALWFFMPADLVERFERTVLRMQSASGTFTSSRFEVAWPDAIQTIAAHPLLGVGFGAYERMAQTVPHNQILDMWVQLGIGGVVLFVWLYVALLRVAWSAQRHQDPLCRGIAIGLFGYLVGGVIILAFGDAFFYPWVRYAFLLTALLVEWLDTPTNSGNGREAGGNLARPGAAWGGVP